MYLKNSFEATKIISQYKIPYNRSNSHYDKGEPILRFARPTEIYLPGFPALIHSATTMPGPFGNGDPLLRTLST